MRSDNTRTEVIPAASQETERIPRFEYEVPEPVHEKPKSVDLVRIIFILIIIGLGLVDAILVVAFFLFLGLAHHG